MRWMCREQTELLKLARESNAIGAEGKAGDPSRWASGGIVTVCVSLVGDAFEVFTSNVLLFPRAVRTPTSAELAKSNVMLIR